MTPAWRLDDAAKRVAAYGGTVPPAEVRRGLRTGWIAKLLFVPERGYAGKSFAEKLWVKVSKARKSEETDVVTYVGTLQSPPESIPDLSLGDVIHFEPRHVCDYVDRA